MSWITVRSVPSRIRHKRWKPNAGKSFGRTEVSEAFLKNGYYQKRQDLIDQGVLKVEGSRVIYTRDTLYKSPSSSAAYLLGRSANGWFEWKNSVGVSLGEAMGRYGATEESVNE
nr:DUF4357 domain-containing protein [Gluconobacter cerinus]